MRGDRANKRAMSRLAMVLCSSLLFGATSAIADGPRWTPEEWEDGSTLQIQTVDAAHEEHWSTVWYVVLSGDVYVRLGTEAAEQIEQNIKSPYVKVRINGLTFKDVRADPANDMVGTVSEEMAYKYPLDVLFRYLPHPLTVRLRAASFD